MIMVTGTNGFIGSNLCNLLDYLNFKVIKVNNFETLKELQVKIKDSIECIVHCAAKIDGSNKAASNNRYIDDKIINFCREINCKLIYLSSTSVYGTQITGPVWALGGFFPDTVYAIEKLKSEWIIKSELKKYIILRISSPYGPRQKQKNIIQRFIQSAYTGRDLYLYSGGQRKQDFIYIDDLCRLILNILGKPEIFGEYNATYGKSISMRELAYIISRRLNVRVFDTTLKDSQINYKPTFKNKDTKKDFSWFPYIDIKEGIDNIIFSLDGEI